MHYSSSSSSGSVRFQQDDNLFATQTAAVLGYEGLWEVQCGAACWIAIRLIEQLVRLWFSGREIPKTAMLHKVPPQVVGTEQLRRPHGDMDVDRFIKTRPVRLPERHDDGKPFERNLTEPAGPVTSATWLGFGTVRPEVAQNGAVKGSKPVSGMSRTASFPRVTLQLA